MAVVKIKKSLYKMGHLYCSFWDTIFKKIPISTIGVGKTKAEARMKAEMEMIERLSLFDSYRRLKPRVRTNDFGELHLNRYWSPRRIFHRNQIQLNPSLNEVHPDQLKWADFVHLNSRKTVQIPIFWIAADPNFPIRETNSNGWATTNDLELSQKLSILELLERDAFLFHWFTQKKPQLISEKRIKKDLTRYQIRFQTPWRVHAVGTIFRQRTPPYLTLGLAADLNLSSALKKSEREALTYLKFGPRSRNRHLFPIDGFYEQLLKTPQDRMLLYGLHDRFQHWKFLIEGRQKRQKSFKNYNWDELMRDLKKFKVDLYSIEIPVPKRPDVHTVATFSPQLIQIEFDYNKRNFGCSRLKGVAWSKLNHQPHPFA